MSEIDVSILIVHTFEKKLLRQTLRSLRRAAPKVSYEVVVIDNNPAAGMEAVLKTEFPDTVYLKNEKNLGFGGAMNVGICGSKGRYVLIFNPDIVVHPESLETMVAYMDTHPDVGVVGPQLLNPDGTIQLSCYTQPSLMQPLYRRTPLGRTSFGKLVTEKYLMLDVDHNQEMDVDSLIGAALFTRHSQLLEVGLFDERFFMYYEDNDLCRRFWEHGFRVVYLPTAKMTHYHRRATADGGLLQQLTNKFSWIQLSSFLKYMKKYRGQDNPRINFEKHGGV